MLCEIVRLQNHSYSNLLIGNLINCNCWYMKTACAHELGFHYAKVIVAIKRKKEISFSLRYTPSKTRNKIHRKENMKSKSIYDSTHVP